MDKGLVLVCSSIFASHRSCTVYILISLWSPKSQTRLSTHHQPTQGRSPGEGNGNLLPYSCLKNPMERGVWRATVQRVRHNWARITPLWKRTVLLVGRKEQCPAKKLCVFLGMRQSTEKLKLSAYTFKLLTINHPTQHKCQRLTYILVPDMSYGCNIYQAIEK